MMTLILLILSFGIYPMLTKLKIKPHHKYILWSLIAAHELRGAMTVYALINAGIVGDVIRIFSK